MSRCVEKALPFVLMVLVILSQVANLIVSKMAMSRGLSFFILALYADLLSTLISLPFAFIFSRCVGQICEFAGTKYGSPTLATAMLNLVPGFKFVLALILRMETVNWRSSSSHAKTIGTLVSIAGAFVLTFYNGPPILNKPSSLPTLLFLFTQQSWILGAFLLAILALSTAICIIGGGIIVVGFYAVMWGKSKENITKAKMLGNSASSSQNAPLLEVHTQN
nr:WAT1-related protein At5g40240-like [Ipomoea batatas]